jgi:uncharacterized membrane protein
MDITLTAHIAAGVMGIVFGYFALYSKKGGPLHRRVGRMFVYAMVVMAVTGIVISATRGVARSLNIPIALLTAYLVITSLTTLREPARNASWLHVGGLLVAVAVGLTDYVFGVDAARGGNPDNIPAFIFFLFGTVALIAAAGDARIIRSGAPRGRARIARHLWRMCFALFIGAMSFFIGQPQVFPAVLRDQQGLRAVPVLAVLGTMGFWLWRARPKGRRLVNDDNAASLQSPQVS